MVDDLDFQSIKVHNTNYVSYHFEEFRPKFHGDIEEKP